MQNERIYLDWSAAAPLRPEALAAVRNALGQPGNPSSPHQEGQRARDLVEAARDLVAALVAAPQREVVLTSSATEALNLALMGPRRGWLARDRRRVIVTAVEHPAVLEPARALAREGFEVLEAPVDADGRLRFDWLERHLDSSTALVAAMHANNETGVLLDVQAVAERARAVGALLLVDAAQTAGRRPVSRHELGAHMLALSSVKLGGPAGAGALVLDPDLELEPLVRGGPHERGLRAGTEATAALAGFGAAAGAASRALASEGAQVTALRGRLERGLEALRPHCRINGAAAERVPGIVSVTLEGVDAEALVVQLDQAGVACSTGSACASGAALPSHVLLAMGRSELEARSTLRLSLGPPLSEGHVDEALRRIEQALLGQQREGVGLGEHSW